MSYVDTTILPESGYTQVNYRQIYDVVAAQMAAHAQWTFIETVDAIVSANTFRTHIWRNNSATSGLSKDFHVGFRLQFVTATEVYFTNDTSNHCVQVVLFEDYDTGTKTASKIAPSGGSSTSFTLQADQTHPLTWVATAAVPTLPGPAWANIGPSVSQTSVRLFVGVTNFGVFAATAAGGVMEAYVGAMDTILGATLDPFPIMVACNNPTNGGQGNGAAASFTRHPVIPPGPTTYAFNYGFTGWHSTATSGAKNFGVGPAHNSSSPTTTAGVMGDASNNSWHLGLGGVVASQCCISTVWAQSGSTRGGLRGYMKNMLTGSVGAHTAGDTFLIDGKAYLGLGLASAGNSAYGLWDTTA